MTIRLAQFALLPICLFALAAPRTLGGPINPPTGPVNSTYKTLADVEPRIALNAINTPGDADSVFTISQPGSYYLTGNISVPFASGKSGIKISTSNVTIDLGGFMIQGFAGTADGIRTSLAASDNIAIHGGTIRGMVGIGINIAGGNTRIDDVAVITCSLAGIYVGTNAKISSCLVSGTTNVGIGAGDRSIVTDCTVTGAGAGIDLGQSCVASGCVAVANAGTGLSVSCDSTVSGCSVRGNGGDGFFACESTFSGCTSAGNTGKGFYAGGGCTITGCSFLGNHSDGLSCFSACLIRGNTCKANTGNGIVATADANRIEGNNVTSNNGGGIRVDGGRNLIMRNSAYSNSPNYLLVANNRYGAIVDVVGGATPAVNGSSAPSTLTSTDPNANFSY